LLPFNLPGLDFRRLMTQAERAEAALMGWVAARRAQPGGRDMLSVLLAAHGGDGEATLGDREAAAQLWTLYLASFHTLSAALSWLLVLLAQHPEEAEAVRAAFADPARRAGETPEAALAAIQEAMRLITPVPFQMRQAADAMALPATELALQPRDTVVLSALVMNRNAAVFPPDPDRFRPGRWTGEAAPAVTDALVFSGGPRFCPGRTFAVAALSAALEAVWTRWRLRLEPGQRLDYKTAITVAPRRVLVSLAWPQAPFRASPIRGRALTLARGLDGAGAADRGGRPKARTATVGAVNGAWAGPATLRRTPRPTAPD
jgi:pentalenene oxygenase